MKKLILSFCVAIAAIAAQAQAPQKFNYQGIARNASGAPLASQLLSLRLSVLDVSASGTPVYVETQTATTNAYGLYNVQIGTGTAVTGNIATVNWGNGDKYLKVEIDPAGGSSYVTLGASQLLSVPYAIYAATAAAAPAWGLTGNGGTSASTNFIGTTDTTNLVFKRDNIQAGLIDSAHGNTSFGLLALSPATTGTYNTGIGYLALELNTTGTHNTATGVAALKVNTTGNYSTGIGYSALYSNTTGSDNTGVGGLALYSNTSGYDNIGIGLNALSSNTTGNYNIAIGLAMAAGALPIGTYNTGDNNVGIGQAALNSNTTGYDNIGVGHNALYHNSTGYYNLGMGNASLFTNTTGNHNTAVAIAALQLNTTGNDNTGTGYAALAANTTGNSNVGYGEQALAANTTGSNNTGLGYYAGNNLPNNVSNTTCVGSNVGWNTTGSNQVNIGNFSVTSISGQVPFGNYSDKRIKDNIQQNVPGLAFISQLKPVTYNLNIHKQYALAMNGRQDTTADYPGKYAIEAITQTGFLAQDVEAAAKAIGYDFSGVEAPKDGEGLYKLRYSDFVMPLVKGMQEQQQQIEVLTAQVKALEARLNITTTK